MTETEQEIKGYLLASPFFREMPDEYLDLISECGHLVSFKAGDFLIREGEDANTFFLVRDGDVAIESNVLGGVLTVSKAGADAIVGFSWLFPPYRAAFDSRAVTDVNAVQLNGYCLRGKVEADHEFGFLFMKRFAEIAIRRLQSTRRQMLDIYGGPQDGKVA